jgi:transposase-like protein
MGALFECEFPNYLTSFFSRPFGVSSAERKTLIRMIALASLSESARKIALDRFRLLQPHLEEKRLLKAVARDAGIGYRTAQRWMMRYRKYGLAGLARAAAEMLPHSMMQRKARRSARSSNAVMQKMNN